MIDISSFDAENAPLLFFSHQIRHVVFVDEQKIDETIEYDDKDGRAMHYLAFDDETPIATGRWRLTKEGIKFERYAVMPKWRNKGIGKELVQAMLDDTISKGLKIYLHAQNAAVNFYIQNGFEIEGDVFYEADIPHFKMKYIEG